MTDVLTVTYDIDEKKNEKGICIVRVEKEKASYNVIKMALDEEAETLYKLITDQTFHTKSLRPQGEWIYEIHSYCKCSNCGFDNIGETDSWIYNYCPICGAEMKH